MSAGRQDLYCCFHQIEKRDIFGGGAGQVGQITLLRHCERKLSIFPRAKMDQVGMDCFVAGACHRARRWRDPVAPRNDASGVIHRHCERMRRGCSNGYARHNDLSTVIRGQQREARLRVDDPRIHLLRKMNLAKHAGLPGYGKEKTLN
jgi:hypothetical protein